MGLHRISNSSTGSHTLHGMRVVGTTIDDSMLGSCDFDGGVGSRDVGNSRDWCALQDCSRVASFPKKRERCGHLVCRNLHLQHDGPVLCSTSTSIKVFLCEEVLLSRLLSEFRRRS